MGDKIMPTKKEVLWKLFNMAYIMARKGWTYIDFEDLANLQVLNGTKFYLSLYVNREVCIDIIQNIVNFLFDEEIAKKLRKVKLIGLLCDGTTNKSVVEQEIICITLWIQTLIL